MSDGTLLQPRVSVVTPAYNAGRTLARACRSVDCQSLADWEHIIVDDGSTDESPRVLAELHRTSTRHIHRTENRGQSAALNFGVRASRGKYIAFLDADDEFLPRHLELRVEQMEAEPELDLTWGGVELVASAGDQVQVPDLERGCGWIDVGKCVVQGTLLVRRHVFEAILFTEDRSIWYQDFDFVRRAKAHSYRCKRFEQATYRYYRDSGTSLVDKAKAAWAGGSASNE